MRSFILIDFLIERVKQLFIKVDETEKELKSHNHDNDYYQKEEIDIMNNIKQNPSVLNHDYRIKEGNNAVVGGPYEISQGCVLEIPNGSTLTVL